MMRSMNSPLPPLIQALLQAERYPGQVHEVELVQTHISWVLLAGDFAYKIRKPVKLGFLDFSTLAQRLRDCEQELRLNRRFAPDMYLDVVGIYHTPEDPRWQGSGVPIEYAVRMRRFEESARLDHVCQRGELTSSVVSALAQAVVAFHASAAVAPPDSRFGTPAHIVQPAIDNFSELMRCLPRGALRDRLPALRRWTESQATALAECMRSRKAAGWVRECHGDLHLGNLLWRNGRVQLFDCIEFNEDLRWMDVASDIAFLSIDLQAHGLPGMANWFVDEVLSLSGDYASARLLRFYAAYRAMVRAKVAALRGAQTGGDLKEIERYIALAEKMMASAAPRLLITHGLSGCGKTVLTDAMLQQDGNASSLRLRSDVERKRLFGLSRDASSDASLRPTVYARDAHQRVYAHLRALAKMLLCAGWSVLVDATFLKQADRQAFLELARELDVSFGILAPQATPEQLRLRIQNRLSQGRDASEATLQVLELQMQTIEALTPHELRWVQSAS